ncbi:unnamed protein product [marine sediment metagenome]|uniref:HTH marR-type domain-containing protein n=2 Tax=marine sediment metagenome TaxID=412755 RepID=X1PX66_9ZZZZ
MVKEEVILTEQQYEVVRLIASQEGAKVSNIAKQLGITLQKVNGSIRGLSKKGIIEADEPGSHSPLYWLCDGVEIKDEQGMIAVFIGESQGAGKGKGGEGGGKDDKDFSTSEEYISFKGLEAMDELKRKELEEWLQTYSIGKKPRNVVLRQYETNPQIRYTRKGLYEALRRAGVKEEQAIGIVDQVFIIEDQYAPYLSIPDRDTLIRRKNPVASQRQGHNFFEDELRDPVLTERGMDMGVGIRQGRHTQRESDSRAGVDKETLREVIREEIGGLQEDTSSYENPAGLGGIEQHDNGLTSLSLPDVEMVEEPILDGKGNPKRDTKGNIIYQKRYIRTDKDERVEKEWRNKYEELKNNFTDLEKRFGDSQMQGELDFLKGKLDSLENNPPGGITSELSVELKKIEQSSKVLEQLLNNVTTLAKAHMGISEEEGKRIGLTDKEIEEIERKRAEGR